ncbi:MAG: flagellar export chaperone FliS [Lachnospiraceae bacterium]
MTLANKAYASYNNTKIMTATPAELTLMLYEGAIKFANLALSGIEKNDIEKSHLNIMKVRDIILEFQSTLNYDYPVAEDFNKVYEYLKQRLTQANLKKDAEIMEEILGHLRTMRDTWKEVMELSRMAQAN